MGIDKPNVAFVIRYDMPRSLEIHISDHALTRASFVQETGRACCNGQKANCLLCESIILLYVSNELNSSTVLSWQDIQRTIFLATQSAGSDGHDIVHLATAKVFALAQYASNLTTCRHNQLLIYVGAPLSDLQPCHDARDICINKGNGFISEIVVTGIAVNIVKLLVSAPVQNAGSVRGIGNIIRTL